MKYYHRFPMLRYIDVTLTNPQ